MLPFKLFLYFFDLPKKQILDKVDFDFIILYVRTSKMSEKRIPSRKRKVYYCKIMAIHVQSELF